MQSRDMDLTIRQFKCKWTDQASPQRVWMKFFPLLFLFPNHHNSFILINQSSHKLTSFKKDLLQAYKVNTVRNSGVYNSVNKSK